MRSNETPDIPVLGIEEIVFEVKDLDRSVAFYQNVIGLMLYSRGPQGAWFRVGQQWLALHEGTSAHDETWRPMRPNGCEGRRKVMKPTWAVTFLADTSEAPANVAAFVVQFGHLDST